MRTFLFSLGIFLVFALSVNAQQITKNVATAGTLSLSADEVATTTSLTLTGKLDARDFALIKTLKQLTAIDLSGTVIQAYEGGGGTGTSPYPADELPHNALNQMTALTKVTLPNTLKAIGVQALNGLPITTISFPATLTTLKDQSFASANLQSVVIPSHITTFGDLVFSNCKSLVSVTLPNDMQEIPTYFLLNCSGLEAITIPASVKKIGNNAFSGTGLFEVTIPASVTEIGASAFYGAGNLEKVTFATGSQLKTIGEQAFYSATKLESISLPEGLSKVGNNAFQYTSALKSFSLPGSLTELPDFLFEKSGLEGFSYTLPNNLTRIGSEAFSSTGKMIWGDVQIPKSVTAMGGIVFRGANIPSIKFEDPAKITFSIGGSNNSGALAFSTIGHADLSNLDVIPAGFFNSATVTQLTLSPNLSEIKERAFQSINLQQTRLELPATLKTLGANAFARLSASSKLEEIDFSKTAITDLPGTTFSRSTAAALKTIKLPATLTTIGTGVFSSVSGLTALYLGNPVPVNLTGAYNSYFSGVDKTKLTLYVPVGSKAAYQAANIWKEFTNIQEYTAKKSQTLPDFSSRLAKEGDIITFPAKTDEGLDVTYSVEAGKESVATLQANILTIVGAGEIKVTAKQSGNDVYDPLEQIITISTSLDNSWLEEPAIAVLGNSASIVGPEAKVAVFTKFYVNDVEVELTDGTADLSDKSGELSLKATTADGSEVIKLKINKQ